FFIMRHRDEVRNVDSDRPMTFYGLRHTYAVLSLQNGDDVKTVQGNLGHATAAFTLDVYGHVSERMKEDSANRMQRYIEGLR
ncbi:MAG: tyrosine-type recombinase/integrase, partial [Clostridiales bacterium]|nr:tyrosine-type recombinase/integrase [Clostridiales bacterium]